MAANGPKEKWIKSKAKALLRTGILAKTITAETNLKDLHQSHPEYSKWPWAQFSRNTKSLIKSLNDPTKRNKCKWAGSEGRRMLKEDILAGTVNDTSDPLVVYESRIEFKVHKFNNFKSNMANLLEAIYSDYERLELDAEVYGHDMAFIAATRPHNLPRPWHRSPCRLFLEKDIDDQKHLQVDDDGKKVTPKFLYESRPEYKEFSLKIFRGHLYQELDKRAKKEYRFEKKKTRMRATRVEEVEKAPKRSVVEEEEQVEPVLLEPRQIEDEPVFE